MFKNIPLELFSDRTGIGRNDLKVPWEGVTQVVSLRSIVKVYSVQFMTDEYLGRLLHSVTLAGDADIQPYAGCKIGAFIFEPGIVQVAQTFVERAKYQALLENFGKVFMGLSSIPGIARLPAVVVIGKTVDGFVGLANYVPPIVEFNTGLHLTDGTHRNFIALGLGASTCGIAIEGVDVPFPCQVLNWSEVKVVNEKPPLEERFISLQPNLFRDLKSIGIDG